MPVDKFGRTPTTTSQNITNVSGVSLGYVKNNVLRKGRASDVNQKNISNLGSEQGPNDAVRRKYVNEKFIRKGAVQWPEEKVFVHFVANTKLPLEGGVMMGALI